MDKVVNFFTENDLFAGHCGIELVEVEPGRAKARMPIRDFHLNGAKTVHGGAIFSLADFTFAVAANSDGRLALAVNVNINFIKAAYRGTLYAVAEELSKNRRLANYQVAIRDADENLIAMFQGTAYRKEENLFR